MNSIYHFFKEIYLKKKYFLSTKSLEQFPFPQYLLSCVNKGKFPDLAIKLNKDRKTFTGGELIELKDSESYSVSSFNSTIPSGEKEISKIIGTGNSKIKKQMEEAGDSILSLPKRDVYYLVRGRKTDSMKVVLVHGSFFETVNTHDLISKSFSQVLNERIKQSGITVATEIKELLSDVFSEQENFSRVREVEKASVKLRFRIMTEVKAEGNILNNEQYPQVLDNTLSFILPKHVEADAIVIKEKMKKVLSNKELINFEVFDIKHHFNGYFRVYQTKLK
ncbi:MAG: hypothetical protein D4R68_06470 [Ignavibacteriales bacterium]|nr:MAG: hypothetical protein D4R68_06470 [Ignavibacteriales bacterium]